MKRIFLTTVIIIASVLAGVNINAQFRYGPTIGAGVTKYSFSQDQISLGYKFGGSAGVMGELMFPGIGFGIDFGLQYNLQGGSMDLGSKKLWADKGYGNETAYMHYIQIPVHLRFKYTKLDGFEDKLAPFAYAGPAINILAGHSKLDCMAFRNVSLGLDIGIGGEINRHWQVSFQYTLGLTNAVSAKILSDFNATCSGFGLKVVYLF